MKKALVFAVLSLNFVFAGSLCQSECQDSLMPLNAQMRFSQMVSKYMATIKAEIDTANKTYSTINQLTGNKYQNYVALRAIKQEQLNELKQINFLLNKLVKMQEQDNKSLELAIKARQIKE